MRAAGDASRESASGNEAHKAAESARPDSLVASPAPRAKPLGGTDAGLSFEPGNPEDLAGCIERLLSSPTLAQDLSVQATDLVQRKYSWGAIAVATARVYATAIQLRAQG